MPTPASDEAVRLTALFGPDIATRMTDAYDDK